MVILIASFCDLVNELLLVDVELKKASCRVEAWKVNSMHAILLNSS